MNTTIYAFAIKKCEITYLKMHNVKRDNCEDTKLWKLSLNIYKWEILKRKKTKVDAFNFKKIMSFGILLPRDFEIWVPLLW